MTEKAQGERGFSEAGRLGSARSFRLTSQEMEDLSSSNPAFKPKKPLTLRDIKISKDSVTPPKIREEAASEAASILENLRQREQRTALSQELSNRSRDTLNSTEKTFSAVPDIKASSVSGIQPPFESVVTSFDELCAMNKVEREYSERLDRAAEHQRAYKLEQERVLRCQEEEERNRAQTAAKWEREKSEKNAYAAAALARSREQEVKDATRREIEAKARTRVLEESLRRAEAIADSHMSQAALVQEFRRIRSEPIYNGLSSSSSSHLKYEYTSTTGTRHSLLPLFAHFYSSMTSIGSECEFMC